MDAVGLWGFYGINSSYPLGESTLSPSSGCLIPRATIALLAIPNTKRFPGAFSKRTRASSWGTRQREKDRHFGVGDFAWQPVYICQAYQMHNSGYLEKVRPSWFIHVRDDGGRCCDGFFGPCKRPDGPQQLEHIQETRLLRTLSCPGICWGPWRPAEAGAACDSS